MLFYFSGENHISYQTSPILSADNHTLAILMVLTLENNKTIFSTERTQSSTEVILAIWRTFTKTQFIFNVTFLKIILSLNLKLVKFFYFSGENNISTQTSPSLSAAFQTLAILLVLTLEEN